MAKDDIRVPGPGEATLDWLRYISKVRGRTPWVWASIILQRGVAEEIRRMEDETALLAAKRGLSPDAFILSVIRGEYSPPPDTASGDRDSVAVQPSRS